MEQYAIGLDLGTSSAKGVLFSKKQGVIANATAPFTYHLSTLPDGSSYNGIDMELFYQTVCSVLKALYQKLPSDGKLSGIAMASASGNTVLCDREGNALVDGYSWVNQSFKEEAIAVHGEQIAADIHNMAGWRPAFSFPLGQLPHLRVHAPTLLDNADVICMSTEYVLHRLTDRWGIDLSTATPSYLLDQENRKWNGKYLENLHVDEGKLPNLMESGELLGQITKKASLDTGLPVGTDVYVGSFDHPTAARACEITQEGELLISCGTSWVCFFPLNDRKTVIDNGCLCDPFLSPEGPWGAMRSLQRVSEAIKAVVDQYISTAPDQFALLDEYAAQAPIGAEGLRFDPMKELPDLSGYSKENIARALMEGVATALKNFLNDAIPVRKLSMCGGPSVSKMWQTVLSYTFGAPVVVTYGPYSGAVGAAMYALNFENE